jgi:hypothetical protein
VVVAKLRAEPNRKGETMPQIIVTAKPAELQGEEAVMLREQVSISDFESQHFANQLVERIGWAVSDANDVEREPTDANG